jgi:hypothetical protein
MDNKKKEVMLAHVYSQMRPYQLEGLKLMSGGGRWLECDDMG